MSRVREASAKEFKLMSVELSNSKNDLTALAKELDITPSYYIAGGRRIQANRIVASRESGR